MSNAPQNGFHYRDPYVMTDPQYSRSWEGRELFAEGRCFNCQRHNLRCIVEQYSDHCMQCAGRRCIFRRTVIVENIPSAFSWPDLIGPFNLGRKRPHDHIEVHDDNHNASSSAMNGVASPHKRQTLSRHHRSPLQSRLRSKIPHDWKTHLRSSLQRSRRYSTSALDNNRNNGNAEANFNQPVAPTLGASGFSLEKITDNSKLFPQTNTIAADEDDFLAAASFIDEVVEEFQEEIQEVNRPPNLEGNDVLHAGPEGSNTNLEWARTMDMSAENIPPETMRSYDQPPPPMYPPPPVYPDVPYMGSGPPPFQGAGGPPHYFYPIVGQDMGGVNMAMDLATSLICQECDFRAKTMSEMKKHQARHQRAHVCLVQHCPRQDTGFATINDLERHMRSVHKKTTRRTKDYKCFAAGCGKPDKIWPRLDNFKQHLIRMHPGQDVDELVRKSEQWWAAENANDEPSPSDAQAAFDHVAAYGVDSTGNESSTLPSPGPLTCNDLQFPSSNDPRALEEHIANCPSCSANRPQPSEQQMGSASTDQSVRTWNYPPPPSPNTDSIRWSTKTHETAYPTPTIPAAESSQSSVYPPPPQWTYPQQMSIPLPKPRPNGYVPTGLEAILQNGLANFPNLINHNPVVSSPASQVASPDVSEPTPIISSVTPCRRCQHSKLQCSADDGYRLCKNCAGRKIDVKQAQLLCKRGKLGEFLPALFPELDSLDKSPCTLDIPCSATSQYWARVFAGDLIKPLEELVENFDAPNPTAHGGIAKNIDMYTKATIPLMSDLLKYQKRIRKPSITGINMPYEIQWLLLFQSFVYAKHPDRVQKLEECVYNFAPVYFDEVDPWVFDRSMYHPRLNEAELLWARFLSILFLFCGIRIYAMLTCEILRRKGSDRLDTYYQEMTKSVYPVLEALLIQEYSASINYLNLTAAADRLGEKHDWYKICRRFLDNDIISRQWKGQSGPAAWRILFDGGEFDTDPSKGDPQPIERVMPATLHTSPQQGAGKIIDKDIQQDTTVKPTSAKEDSSKDTTAKNRANVKKPTVAPAHGRTTRRQTATTRVSPNDKSTAEDQPQNQSVEPKSSDANSSNPTPERSKPQRTSTKAGEPPATEVSKGQDQTDDKPQTRSQTQGEVENENEKEFQENDEDDDEDTVVVVVAPTTTTATTSKNEKRPRAMTGQSDTPSTRSERLRSAREMRETPKSTGVGRRR